MDWSPSFSCISSTFWRFNVAVRHRSVEGFGEVASARFLEGVLAGIVRPHDLLEPLARVRAVGGRLDLVVGGQRHAVSVSGAAATRAEPPPCGVRGVAELHA